MDYFGEFLGTCLLIFLGNGVVAANNLKTTKASNQGWIMIVIGWGLAVTVSLYAIGDFSPGHLNPAVTITFASLGKISWGQAGGYIGVQLLGAMVGQLLVYLFYRPHFQLMIKEAAAFDCFATRPALDMPWDNLLSEALATFVFVSLILVLPNYNFGSDINPILVGAVIISVGFSLGSTTGFAINPARDLGPRIIYHLLPGVKWQASWNYAWVPVLGPILGAVVAGKVFILISQMIL